MSPTLGVVGDDVTGVLSVGGEIASRGLRTALVRDSLDRPQMSRDAPGGDCILMSTDSRHDTPADALEKASTAASALRDAGVRYLVKKTDSLLRGNIGPEMVGALQGFGARPGLCIFAAPSQGRTTVNGIQLVSRRRLAAITDPGSYLRSGEPEANVYKLLKAHAGSVGHVKLDVVERGTADVGAELVRHAANDVDFVVCDAASSADVATSVRAAVLAGFRLFVGTTDMGSAIADALIAHGEIAAAPPVLIVSGTLSATGRDQVRHAVSSGLADLVEADVSTPSVARAPSESVTASARELGVLLAAGRNTILTPAGDPPADDAPVDVAHEVATRLAELAAGVLAAVPVSGLVATGGDIAEALLRELGADELCLSHEVLPGVPEAVISDGPHAGLRFVAKPGSFGSRSSFADIARWLQTNPSSSPLDYALPVGDPR